MEADVAIIGAGPAGLACAVTAAEKGMNVCLIDENETVGGQIWKGDLPLAAKPWIDRLEALSINLKLGYSVVDCLSRDHLLLEGCRGAVQVKAKSVVLACGARELFLPFKGWTLPGVYGIGGLQSLVKGGMHVKDVPVLLAGTGPLMIEVASFLKDRGARLKALVEQARLLSQLQLLTSLPMSKWHQAGSRLLKIIDISRFNRTRVIEALGDGKGFLEAVVLEKGSKKWTVPCKILACSYGLIPNLELPQYLGCDLYQGFVRVDPKQRTSIPDILAVGELTGIGGADKSLVEGVIAGHTLANEDPPYSLLKQKSKTTAFSRKLMSLCQLEPELLKPPESDVLYCRCEDVKTGDIAAAGSWKEASLRSRCGMGPCQGRICASAAQIHFNFHKTTTRPPLIPCSITTLSR